MKTSSRALSLIAAMTLASSLAACGSDTNDPAGEEPTTNGEESADESDEAGPDTETTDDATSVAEVFAKLGCEDSREADKPGSIQDPFSAPGPDMLEQGNCAPDLDVLPREVVNTD